jgi:hypothetical protein
MYGRPWAQIWDKYWEQGMEKPEARTSSASSKPFSLRGATSKSSSLPIKCFGEWASWGDE